MIRYTNLLVFLLLIWMSISSGIRLLRYRTRRNFGIIVIVTVFLVAAGFNLFLPRKIPSILWNLLKLVPGGIEVRAAVLIFSAIAIIVIVWMYLVKRQFIVGTVIMTVPLAAAAAFYTLFEFPPETRMLFKIFVNVVAFLCVLGGFTWGYLHIRKQGK